MKKMVILGTGPGLGMSLAKKFGANDYEIILLARSQNSLEKYCNELSEMNIIASYYVVDASIEDSVKSVLTELCKDHGHIDLFIYNIGFLKPNKPLELTQKNLLRTFQVDVASSLLATQIITRYNNPDINTDIIFTGGGLAISPERTFTSLSIGKSGLRSLVLVLAQEFVNTNTFISTVTICGGIKPNTHFDPDRIARVYWETIRNRNQVEVIYR